MEIVTVNPMIYLGILVVFRPPTPLHVTIVTCRGVGEVVLCVHCAYKMS